jgi:hypothetical protein
MAGRRVRSSFTVIEVKMLLDEGYLEAKGRD